MSVIVSAALIMSGVAGVVATGGSRITKNDDCSAVDGRKHVACRHQGPQPHRGQHKEHAPGASAVAYSGDLPHGFPKYHSCRPVAAIP